MPDTGSEGVNVARNGHHGKTARDPATFAPAYLTAGTGSASLVSRGHVAACPVARHWLFEDWHLLQAADFLGARLSRAQDRAAGVKAASCWNVGRVRWLACQDLVRLATTDLGGYGKQGFRVGAR